MNHTLFQVNPGCLFFFPASFTHFRQQQKKTKQTKLHPLRPCGSSRPARRRPLWPTADLNYCNQRMKSNQHPCMSCWQNAWPPALSTNQTAASHSLLITTCTQSPPLPSHLVEEVLFSFCLFVAGLTGVDWLDEGWRCKMELFFLCLYGGSHGFPILAPAEETVCTKVKFHIQI